MSKKVRELKALLLSAGFIHKHTKGSHEKWIHPHLPQSIIIAGKDSDDAKPYLEKQIITIIEKLKKMQENIEK